MFVPKKKATKYAREKLIELQGEIDEPTTQLETSTPFYQKWTDTAGRKISKTIYDKNPLESRHRGNLPQHNKGHI